VDEQFVQVGPTRLCFDVQGEDCDPTVVLVMGLNLDLVWWRDELCQDLVDRGLRVVRFDNRDVGRSTSFPGTPMTLTQFLRRRADPVYSLGDMADDTAGLIDHVAPHGAHVVGASLGSFVAQETAIRHPGRVRSLTSIMGRTGDRKNGKVAWSQRAGFFRPVPSSLDRQAEAMVRTFHRMGSVNRTQQDDDDVRHAVRRSAARAEGGGPGQLAAVLSERDRTADLRALDLPALVVHGEKDKLILPSGGRVTAAAIPGAELMLVPGMGHDLPRWLWPQLVDGIVRTVERAATRAA
jgi:pimeloyl-ACP methyl ester carboxylesterase